MGLFSTKTRNSQKTILPDHINKASKDIVDSIIKNLKAGFLRFQGEGVPDLSRNTVMANTAAQRIANTPAYGIRKNMNPYMDEVLAPTLRDMEQQRQIGQNGLNAEAAMSGAFGDARHGVMAGMMDHHMRQERDDVIGKVMAQAFESALAQRQQSLANLQSTGATADKNAQDRAAFGYQEFLRKIRDSLGKTQSAAQTLATVPHESTIISKGKQPGGIGNTLVGAGISLLPKI
jgi:hypothetical protein